MKLKKRGSGVVGEKEDVKRRRGGERNLKLKEPPVQKADDMTVRSSGPVASGGKLKAGGRLSADC